MRLQVWDNGNDRVIAESAEQAKEMLKAAIGCGDEDLLDPFEVQPDDQALTINDEDGNKITRTLGGWIAGRGPGYLCSRDW